MIPAIIGGDEFLAMLAAYRVLWIGGRYGGGKTTLGFWLGSWLYASGRAEKIMTNIESVIADPVQGSIDNTAIILDESWMFLESWGNVKRYAAYLRKKNLFMILPSVFPPHKRMTLLSCHRWFNAMVAGLPLWIYRWDLQSASIKEHGFFGVWQPQRAFELFNSKAIPSDDGGIVDLIEINMGVKHEEKTVNQPRPQTETTPPPILSEAQAKQDRALARAIIAAKRGVKLSADESAALASAIRNRHIRSATRRPSPMAQTPTRSAGATPPRRSDTDQTISTLKETSEEIAASLGDAVSSMAQTLEEVKNISRRR